METIRLSYKNDAYGNPIFARVAWSKNVAGPKPIGTLNETALQTAFQLTAIKALIYHGGGLIVGSSEMIPKVQVEYLANEGFIVVIPNYRLAPQVTAKDAFADCEESYDWATSSLAQIMRSEYDVEVDSSRVVTMGHS